MIDNLPIFITLIFIATTFLTLLFFILCIKNSEVKATQQKATPIFIGLIIWLLVQMVLTLNNVYKAEVDLMPPKIFLFGILPPILTIVFLFLIPKGRAFIDSIPLKNTTFLNVIRIPVELILYWLFLQKVIPELMTFEGRNFDILAGITAPIIAYYGFSKNILSRNIILLWNFISLALLLNIVVNALLAAPSPMQQFGFDQPNIALLNFPFSWLPTFIVPVVLFGHLISIRQLLKLPQKTLR